jgi:Fe(3+) dicitrate transport protein
MRIRLLAILLICTLYAFAQQATITGSITTSTGEGASFANLYFPELNIGASSAFDGSYEIKNVPDGEHRLSISFVGYQRIDTIVSIRKDKMRLNFTLVAVATQIDAVDVNDEPLQTTVYNRLKSIEGVAIYAAKKNEVIEMKNITANTSSNNARQVFARVPGINVWESDAAGLQLGVGARGLSPDRTANFNTRQNGYDMAADALGYPESYYASAAIS